MKLNTTYRIITAFFIGAFLLSASNLSERNKYFEISKNIEIFANLYKEINTFYVDEIEPGELMRTGIDAMLQSLDPYTNYYSESEIEGYKFMTDGNYNGVGLQVKKIKDNLIVVEVQENQPAHTAGVEVGDILIAIDGKPVKGKSVKDIAHKFKGFPNTTLAVELKKTKSKDNIVLNLTRKEVKSKNVPFSGMVSDNIGYISLTTFTRNAGNNVAKALSELKQNDKLQGVILDLRGNGGGLLTEAVAVSNVFVPKGIECVSTKGKVEEWDRSFKTPNNPVDLEIPLVVLIDDGSASASEIVSGVIQDLDRGVLIGQQSYGKGLVQNTRDVGYNAKVKLTTAKYYIPSGRCIQALNYEDGKPVHVDISQRTPFNTKNGRKVYDGNGLKPDIIIPAATDINTIKDLVKKYEIFNFVTEYTSTIPKPEHVEDIQFTEVNKFFSYLEKIGYQYESDTKKALKVLLENAKTDELLNEINTEIDQIKLKINQQHQTDLKSYEKVLRKLIEKEIAKRFFFQTGEIEMSLRNDDEIKKAISVLNNPTEYKDLLK